MYANRCTANVGTNVGTRVPAWLCKALTRLVLPLFLFVLVHPAANAMRIGDITVSSAVGERFFAIIPISDTRRVRAEQILVTLAPRSVYQRMGVDWEYFHTGLIFDVLEDERDGIYLRIVSKDVVFEPFIDFVISIRWPSGFISRQYTVLLDMPLSSAQASPAARASRAQPEPATRSGTIVRETPALGAQAAPESEAIVQSTPIAPPVSTRRSDVQSRPQTVIDSVSEPDYLGGEQASREAAELARAQEAAMQRAEAQARARAQAEARAREEAAARARAEEEARAQAAAAAKASAEAEARARAETEARRRAEAQARASEIAAAQAEAQARSEAAAREEAERRARLENEAAEKAQAEARARAAAQARAEEEAAARARAEAQAKAQAAAAERARLAAEERAEAARRAEQQRQARQAEEKARAQAERLAQQQQQQKAPLDVTSEPAPDARASTQVEQQPASGDENEADTNKRAASAPAQPSWAHVSKSGDTLWAIARRIQRESGGRIVDIVNALHRNNATAFIGNDANRLRVDAQLNVSMAQIRAATPASRRAKYWPEGSLLAVADNEAGTSAAAPEAKAEPEPAVEKSVAAAKPATTQTKSRTGTDGKDGVLSLVTRDESAEDVSQLTRELSEELQQNSAEVDAQLSSGQSRATGIEDRMENILAQYDALSEKTAQLKALEATLNRRIAEKAQVDVGLAGLPAPQVPEVGEGQASTQQRSIWWWLQLVVLLALLGALVVLATIVLRKRQQQRRSAYVDSWDNDLVRSDRKLSDDELAEMVKLKGESAYTVEEFERGGPDDLTAGEGGAELQASLYIAYERYDEAEELLTSALQEQPANHALQNQLLDVYRALGKTEAYERLAQDIARRDADDPGKLQSNS